MLDEIIGNPQVTATEIGWMAGIIDGEGYLGLPEQHGKRGRSVKVEISVVNTDFDTINRYVELLRKTGINPYIRARVHNKKTWKANCVVTVGRMNDAKRLLELVLPHLTGHKKQRAVIIHALVCSRIPKTDRRNYDAYELGLIDQICMINLRAGTPTTAREAVEKLKIQSVLYREVKREVRSGIPA